MIPDKKRVCGTCGSAMVFFLQHAHGNYPLMDYLCPHCDLGEDVIDPESVQDRETEAPGG